MCGRFSLTIPIGTLGRQLGVSLPPGLEQHYAPRGSIAPGDPVLALRQEHGRPEAALMLWGLLPEWSKDALAAVETPLVLENDRGRDLHIAKGLQATA